MFSFSVPSQEILLGKSPKYLFCVKWDEKKQRSRCKREFFSTVYAVYPVIVTCRASDSDVLHGLIGVL